MLLILAVVAIGAMQNDGIINHAKNAREEYGKAQVNENTTLDEYLDKIESNAPGSNDGGSDEIFTMTVAEAQSKGLLSIDANTEVVDEYGNKIVVPAGFKITTDAHNVTEGIVIEDCTETGTKGSQFVWIPVGNVYYSKTEYKTITLGRYEDFNLNDAGEYVPAQSWQDYKEEILIQGYKKEYINSEGHSMGFEKRGYTENEYEEELFVTNAIVNGGYYFARYEAGKQNGALVCKMDQVVYEADYSTSLSLSKSMYTSDVFTSELVNSYAWDTAIIFIQTFSTETDGANYANLNKSTSEANTGINPDKYCNIYDMSGNRRENSTEIYEKKWYEEEGETGLSGWEYEQFYSIRGGFFWGDIEDDWDKNYKTSHRDYYMSLNSFDDERKPTFRPILYVTQ